MFVNVLMVNYFTLYLFKFKDIQKYNQFASNAIQLGFIYFNFYLAIALKLKLIVALQKIIQMHAQSVMHLCLDF